MYVIFSGSLIDKQLYFFLKAMAKDNLEVHHVSNMKADTPTNKKLDLNKVSPHSLISPRPFILVSY
jgi:hypothetical protein